MKGSKIACGAVALILAAASLGAEQLSKIAVINIERVYESYPQESQIFRQIEELVRTRDARLGEYALQIDEIDLAILEARNADDEITREELTLTRQDIVNDRRSYNEIMGRRIEAARRQIADLTGIAQEILRAIEFVAIDQGYSQVVDVNAPGLWWYSKEIDVTDLVINRLRAIAR